MDLSGLIEKWNQAGTKYYEDSVGDIIAKTCSKCGEVKNLSDYNASKQGLGGKRSACRACQGESNRKYHEENADYFRKYREENAAAIREYGRKYREENADIIRKRKRRWYEDNPDYYPRYREKNADVLLAYREENADVIRENSRKWRENNPNYLRDHRENNRRMYQLYVQRRRARRALLPNTLTESQQAEVFAHFNGGCALTGTSEDIHFDHVIPLATGYGGTIYENMIPLRGDLNTSKSTRCIFDWFYEEKERFELSQRNFDNLIEYLAGINDMTVEEYEEYVRWCHDNPRSIDEIKAEKETEPAS